MQQPFQLLGMISSRVQSSRGAFATDGGDVQQHSSRRPRRHHHQHYHNHCTVPSSAFCFALFLGYSLQLLSVSSAIRITRFVVPEAVERGQPAVLSCDYALDAGEALYSIKLYKNNVEFYRFVPGENPPIQSYTLDGVYVNMTESNATHAVLTRTNLHSDGLYVCEISTESPAFSTVRREQLMKIYVLPNESLVIEGALEQYNLGDNISLVCRSGRAHPPLRLQWFVNDMPVDARYTTLLSGGGGGGSKLAKRNESSSSLASRGNGSAFRGGSSSSFSSSQAGGLQATSLALNMYAKGADFQRGVLEIRCTATLTIVYEYESTEHLVTGSFKNRSLNNHNSNHNNNYHNHHHSSSGTSSRREWPHVKTPVIEGMKRNYQLNETLNLNCSSAVRNAKLKWFIMNREVNDAHLVRYPPTANRGGSSRSPPYSEVLGLRLLMEKRLIQMPELRLHCRSYSSRQIAQVHAKLQIRTYDNQSWESQFASSSSGGSSRAVAATTTSVPIILTAVLSSFSSSFWSSFLPVHRFPFSPPLLLFLVHLLTLL